MAIALSNKWCKITVADSADGNGATTQEGGSDDAEGNVQLQWHNLSLKTELLFSS